MIQYGLMLAALVALGSCSGDTECGALTHEENGQCVPDQPTDSYTCQDACEKRILICGLNEFNGDMSDCVETCLGQSAADRKLHCFRDATCVEISEGDCNTESKPPISDESECVGISIDCDDLGSNATDCGNQQGCHWTDSFCAGSSDSCYHFLSSADCNGQRGCQWEHRTENGDCIGNSVDCVYLDSFDATECNTQLGCYWTGTSCAGEKVWCLDFFSRMSCNNQLGCLWDVAAESGDCIGDSVYCSNFNSDATECDAQLGCYWTGTFCPGVSAMCEDLLSQNSCDGVQGCTWQTP